MNYEDKVKYDDKVGMLANAIMPHVEFDSVTHAREFVLWYKLPQDSDIVRQLNAMTDNFMSHSDRFNITYLIADIGTSVGTKHSALREAIKICAQRVVERYQLNEPANLGSLNRRAAVAMVIS